MAEKQLLYMLDDRETTVSLTTLPGSQHVAIELIPPTASDHQPGFRLMVYQSLEAVEAIREFLVTRVLLAFRQDGVPDRQPMQVPFELGIIRLVMMLTPNDVKNLCGHLASIVTIARSLALVGVNGI